MNPLQEELDSLRNAGLYRSLKTIDSDQDAVLVFEGRKLLNFSSNNYLGLANDPRLKRAAMEATERFGTGSGASRLITGSMGLHRRLEEKIARFKGTETALVFNSGYQANIGVLTALTGEGDRIFSDELNHASIVDGCRLSKASVRIYRHGDMDHLEDLLKSETGGKRLIATDSIFSMDGDAAPLKDLAALAEKYDCWLMVDEAHATGVLGPTGKGLVDEIWPRDVPSSLRGRLIQMGTLGKALGSFGAYIAAAREVIEILINKARSFIYTTALPPGVLAAALEALEIVERDPSLRERLWENVRHFSKSVSGFKKIETNSPIFPWIIGDSKKTVDFSQRLFEKGFWVGAIRSPTVPKGTERLRITVMATHTKEQIDSLVEVLHGFR
jgi:8-amino-7-oxononanoate synthase